MAVNHRCRVVAIGLDAPLLVSQLWGPTITVWDTVSMADASLRHGAELEALRKSVLDSPGQLGPDVRLAAYEESHLEPPLREFVAKVRRDSARMVDADVASLQSAGLSEDEILELTLAAALGAATEILRSGLDVLQAEEPA